MCHGHRHLVVEQLFDLRRRALDALDAVVEVVDLPAAQDLAADGVRDDAPVVLHDVGLDGLAVLRRLLDGGHVAQAGEGHVERARDRCGREGQTVDLPAHFLELFLVADAEALLLVDDDEAEIFEFNVLLQQAVRADDKVGAAVAHCGEGLADLRGRAVAVEQMDVHGEAEKALHRGLVVLLGQNRRRHQKRRLFAVEDALHDRAQRDFGLAVTDVAAEQAVHRLLLFHVRLDLLNAAELVICLLIAEFFLKFYLPRRIRCKGVALEALALGVELNELLGELFGGGLRAGLGFGPLRAAHFGELDWCVLARADVF